MVIVLTFEMCGNLGEIFGGAIFSGELPTKLSIYYSAGGGGVPKCRFLKLPRIYVQQVIITTASIPIVRDSL